MTRVNNSEEASKADAIDTTLRISLQVPSMNSAKHYRLYNLEPASHDSDSLQQQYTICEAYHDMQQYNHFQETYHYTKTLPPLVQVRGKFNDCTGEEDKQVDQLSSNVKEHHSSSGEPEENDEVRDSFPPVDYTDPTDIMDTDGITFKTEDFNNENATDNLRNAKAEKEARAGSSKKKGKRSKSKRKRTADVDGLVRKKSSKKSNPELAICEPIVAISEPTKLSKLERELRKSARSTSPSESPELPPGPVSAKRKSLEKIRAKELKRQQEETSPEEAKKTTPESRLDTVAPNQKVHQVCHWSCFPLQPPPPPQPTFLKASPMLPQPQPPYNDPLHSHLIRTPLHPMPPPHQFMPNGSMPARLFTPPTTSASPMHNPFGTSTTMIPSPYPPSPQPTMPPVSANKSGGPFALPFNSPTYSSPMAHGERLVNYHGHAQYNNSNDNALSNDILRPVKKSRKDDNADRRSSGHSASEQRTSGPLPLQILQDSLDPRQRLVQLRATDRNISVARNKADYHEAHQPTPSQTVFSGPHYQPEKYSIKPVLHFRKAFFKSECYGDDEDDEEQQKDNNNGLGQQHRSTNKKSRYFIPNLYRFFQAALEDGSYFESYDDYDPSDIVNFRHAYQPQQYPQINGAFPEGQPTYQSLLQHHNNFQQQKNVNVVNDEAWVWHNTKPVPLCSYTHPKQNGLFLSERINEKGDDDGQSTDSEGSNYEENEQQQEAGPSHHSTAQTSVPEPTQPEKRRRGRPRKYPVSEAPPKKPKKRTSTPQKKKGKPIAKVIPHEEKVEKNDQNDDDDVNSEEELEKVDALKSINTIHTVQNKHLFDDYNEQRALNKGKMPEELAARNREDSESPNWSRAGSIETFDETYELVSDEDAPGPSSVAHGSNHLLERPAFALQTQSNCTYAEAKWKNKEEVHTAVEVEKDNYQNDLSRPTADDNGSFDSSKGNHPVQTSFARRGRKFRITYNNSRLSSTHESLRDQSNSDHSSRSSSVPTVGTTDTEWSSSRQLKRKKPWERLNWVLPSDDLICTICKQHDLPQSTWNIYKFPEGYLEKLEETRHERRPGFTGQGASWDPRVFIQCEHCQVKLHCGCAQPPVKGYPMKYSAFLCNQCQEKEIQGKHVPTIPAGSKVSRQNITKGSRRAAAHHVSYRV